MEDKMQSSDHDLLIRIETKMESLIVDIKDLKCSTNTQMTDHESRIKKLESKTITSVVMLTIYSSAIAGLIGLLIYHITGTQINH